MTQPPPQYPTPGYPSQQQYPAQQPDPYPAQPPAPRGTNGFAIASLACGLLGAVPLGVIFGFVALRQVRRHGQDGKGMAITGLVLSGVWVLVFAAAIAQVIRTGAERDSDGNLTGGGTVQATSLKVGDCINDLKESQNVTSIPAVPCSQLHEGEVYATFTISGSTWPGTTAVTDQAEKQCGDLLGQYAPKAVDDDKLQLFFLHPTESSWRLGDRVVTCVATDPAKRTGSIKG